jgi:hypothetical protein
LSRGLPLNSRDPERVSAPDHRPKPGSGPSDPSIGSNGPSPAPVSFDPSIGPNGPCPAPALGRIPNSTNWVSTATTTPLGFGGSAGLRKSGVAAGSTRSGWHKTGGPGNCRGRAWGRRRQAGFDGQTVSRNKAQGQTPHRGCLRWCLVVILFSFRKKIDSGYVYRVYGVLEGSSRTTFAGAHVVQGEGGYGGLTGLFPRYRQPCGVGGC